MKIMITGASSFIGKALIRKLAVPGNLIYAIVRKRDERCIPFLRRDNIKLIECRMEDYGRLYGIIAGKCDGMIHLAWEGTRGQEREDTLLQKKNYVYSVKALEQAAALGCQWIVLAGSQAEYGLYPDSRIYEDMPGRPLTAYGIHKLLLYNKAVEICNRQGIRVLEPRFFSVYGAGDWENSLVMSCLRRMTANEDCFLTECTQNWNFLYIDDAADGVIRLILNENTGGIYNLASHDTRVLKEFINEMYTLTVSRSRLHFGTVPYGKEGAVSFMPDCSKMKREAGWMAATSFTAGIKRILKEDFDFAG